jgi:predicted ATPase
MKRPLTPESDLQIDHPRRLVMLRGEPIKLGGRAFDILLTLVAKPGRVFTADELVQAVWPGRVMDETNLRAQIRKLRQQIGNHRIVNVSGRGYAYAASAQQAAPSEMTAEVPSPSAELLGRDPDLAALAHLAAKHRLVTLLGAGGMGKTQLALALARQTQAAQRGGVWWVELASLRAAGELAQAVAQAVRLDPGGLTGPAAGVQLGAALAGHEGLLVLDSAEHLAVPLAALLHALLPLAPGLSVLVTSQQRLQLASEQVYRLEPLPTKSALQLLVRRAQAVDHRFRLEPHQLEPAAHLCDQLDGLPLALEMAGARLPLLGLAALQQHLGERLRLLSADVPTVPERQRTLQLALEWSHALLAPEEQAVLRRLSVFAAPFTLDSAQIVAAAGALDAVAVARAVAALVDKSMLQLLAASAASVANPVPRWRLLETTRLFAATQLDAHGERQLSEARHAQAMAVRADAAQAAFWVLGDHAWMAAWGADHQDFLLGFDRALAFGDGESAAVIGDALEDEANLTGLYAPVRNRVDKCLALLPQCGPLGRARMWNRTTWPGANLSEVEAAARRVQAWRLVGDPMGLARALARWVATLVHAGNSAMAQGVLTELRSIEQPHWPPRQRAMGVPVACLFIAEVSKDAEMMREAMLSWQTLARQGALSRLAVQAETNLALVDVLQGRPDQALIRYAQTVAEHRARGQLVDAVQMLGCQVKVLLMLEDADTAADLLEQALMTTYDFGAMGRLTQAAALLALASDQPEMAECLLAAAAAYDPWLRAPIFWEGRQMDDLRGALDRRLDAATRERCRAEGERLEATDAHRVMLDWLRAQRRSARSDPDLEQ